MTGANWRVDSGLSASRADARPRGANPGATRFLIIEDDAETADSIAADLKARGHDMGAGMVVGSSGIVLTLLMAKAMNRSVSNVLFSNFGDVALEQQSSIKGRLKPVDAGDAGIAMRYAGSVIIVPGYGLAAAQAQQMLYEFAKLLQAAGVDVKFAIHPVAGRMPGHMDGLLAEAGVPYDIIYGLDDINDDFKNTDICVVVGANDVVNPAAGTDKKSPIYGMPILNVDQSHQVHVIKRGQGRGYAGVENELFYKDKCNMVYGDAKTVLEQMIEAVRGLGDSSSQSSRAATTKVKEAVA